MKKCKICKIEKPLNDFGKRKTMKSGYKNDCRKCEAIQRTDQQRTPSGLFGRIYSHQQEASRKRGHKPPTYTVKELRNKYLNTELYRQLHAEWVVSGYDKYKAPSFDRLDNFKGYSFDNIQLVTWEVNDRLGSIFNSMYPNKGTWGYRDNKWR